MTFYCACIASAALTHILEPAYRVFGSASPEGREAYKSYLDDCERGKYDEDEDDRKQRIEDEDDR